MDNETFSTLPKPVALVVDDEPLVLMDTADMVAEAGFHVIEAHTVDEAFSFLKNHASLKLLLTDIQTPGEMNGIELAKYVCEHWPHISVVVTSGAVEFVAGELPASARFLSKPLRPELVSKTLEEIR
jgi:CheY-like chemotaxis protein